MNMADVISRTSSLPGARHTLPAGQVCDTHEDRLAVVRRQGETDSFGAELNDLCAECDAAYLAAKAAAYEEEGTCGWCASVRNGLKAMRDLDEGMSGPVYQVCEPCRTRHYERAAEELAELRESDGEFFDDLMGEV
jgi:hypothetical protein